MPRRLRQGLLVFCVEEDTSLPSDAVIIKHKNTRKLLALMSANFFPCPLDGLLSIAITGARENFDGLYDSSILRKAGRKWVL